MLAVLVVAVACVAEAGAVAPAGAAGHGALAPLAFELAKGAAGALGGALVMGAVAIAKWAWRSATRSHHRWQRIPGGGGHLGTGDR